MTNILLLRATPLPGTFWSATAFPANIPLTLKNIAFAPATSCTSWERCGKIQDSRAPPTVLPAAIGQSEQGFLSAAAADLQRRAAIESMLPPGSAPPRIPQSRPVETEIFDLNPPVVLMKGTSGEPFFISWRSQRDVVEELAWRSILYIWGGPLLALAGLWLLLSQFLAR